MALTHEECVELLEGEPCRACGKPWSKGAKFYLHERALTPDIGLGTERFIACCPPPPVLF